MDKKTSSDKELSEGPLLSAVEDSVQDESKADAAILALSEGPLSSDSEQAKPAAVPAAAATATALELRFQAELNQMEVIQQAEKQLGQISQFKDAVDACHKAAVRHIRLLFLLNAAKGRDVYDQALFTTP